MLSKLLEYEFRTTGRTMLPVFGAMLVVAALLTVFSQTSLDVPVNILVVLYFAIGVALIVLTVSTVITEFQNLISKNGYFMMTLPVTPAEHIGSRMITSSVWMFLAALVSILSLFIISSVWPEPSLHVTAPLVGIIVEMLVLLYVSMVLLAAQIYASISLGCVVRRYRGLVQFLIFLGLSWLESRLMSLHLSSDFTIKTTSIHLSAGIAGETFSQIAVQTGIVIAIEIAITAVYFFLAN